MAHLPGWLGVAITLLAATPAPAATYFVDRSHPAASDANPGTAAQPWRTLQHAADSVAAGDAVLVRAGTYAEHVRITRAGEPGREISFAAYPGDTVTIDGAGIALAEWAGLVQVLGARYVRFSGFHVANAGPHGTNTGIQVEDAAHVVIADNHTSYTASSGILVWSSSDVLIAGNEIDHAANAGTASRNECLTIGRTTRFEVRDNHVHDGHPARGEGIDAKDGSSWGTIHHNHVHHVQGVGIYLDAWTEHTHHLDVYGNRVHDVDGTGFYVGSEQGGLLEHVRLFNNVAWHNRFTGLTIHRCCTDRHPLADVQVINNSFWGNGWESWGGGIGNENDQVSGLVIRNNAVAGNLSFEIAMEDVDPALATLDHNLIGAWHGYPGELCGADCQLGDPRFVAAASGDLRLLEGSPAIDRGSAALAPAEDLAGTPRPQGTGFDIGAFEHRGASPSCTPGATTLCLNRGRFAVAVEWQSGGRSGPGQGVALTADTGYFWFFAAGNVELVVKVLDACVFGRYWVFAAGLTDVAVTITVTDTATGAARIYRNPEGTPFPPIQDTSAFATCP